MGAALLGGGVSGCEGEGVWVLVFAEVVPVVFLLEVVLPVGVVVVVGVEGRAAQEVLGAGGGPARSGSPHAVFDKGAAGPFEDAGGDGPPGGEGGGVAEVGLLGVEVGQDPGDVLRVLGALGRVLGGEAGDQAGDPGGAAVQDVQDPGGGPVLDDGVTGREKSPAGFPHVFHDVDQVDDDGYGDAPARGRGLDQGDLVVVAVDQGDPVPFVPGVAQLGLVEEPGDGLVPVRGDVGPVAAGHRLWRRVPLPFLLLSPCCRRDGPGGVGAVGAGP